MQPGQPIDWIPSLDAASEPSPPDAPVDADQLENPEFPADETTSFDDIADAWHRDPERWDGLS